MHERMNAFRQTIVSMWVYMYVWIDGCKQTFMYIYVCMYMYLYA